MQGLLIQENWSRIPCDLSISYGDKEASVSIERQDVRGERERDCLNVYTKDVKMTK
jgi:hypothetical protein